MMGARRWGRGDGGRCYGGVVMGARCLGAL